MTDLFRGLDPKQKLATSLLAGITLFFMGYVGSTYLHRPQPIEIVQQTSGSRAQPIVESVVPQSRSVTVHIVGAVTKPDVYTMPVGTNVNDLIKAAGGALKDADLASINLAEKIIDGTQIRIPKKGEVPTLASAPSIEIEQRSLTPTKSASISVGLVSINSATLEELDTLPGIGPAKARAIIEYRTKIGGFKTIEELNAVKGIGDKTMADLRPRIKL